MGIEPFQPTIVIAPALRDVEYAVLGYLAAITAQQRLAFEADDREQGAAGCGR